MILTYYRRSLFRQIIYLLIVVVIGYVYIKWPFYNYIKYSWSFWAWLGGLFVLVTFFEEIGRGIGNRRQGREAELDVEDKLFELPDNFKILSNLIIGDRGNIDEVVVAPTGIWVIEVKSHPGKIGFNGTELTRNGYIFQEKNFFSQVWAQKRTVEETIFSTLNQKYHVQPVIVFSDPGADVRLGLKPINGVYVIGYNWINKLIHEQNAQRSLDQNTINLIVEILSSYIEKPK